jgi:hypothetical protein
MNYSKMGTATDLKILNEIALEIKEYRTTGLPGSLRKLISTKRGEFVAKVLEETAESALRMEWVLNEKIRKLQTEVSGLRDENQQLTELVEKLEKDVDKTLDFVSQKGAIFKPS